MSDEAQVRSRREEYAWQTRQDVVAAARKLFATQGYAGTTVESIARAARVSPATVYAQCGGKEGLLGSLMDTWTSGDLVQRIIANCAAEPDPRAALDVLAEGYLEIYRQSGDIIRIVTAAAASTTSAQQFLTIADSRHREALAAILEPLVKQGALIEGLTAVEAAEIVFFHFHFGQFSLAAETFGWGEDRAAEWITERIAAAILRP